MSASIYVRESAQKRLIVAKRRPFFKIVYSTIIFIIALWLLSLLTGAGCITCIKVWQAFNCWLAVWDNLLLCLCLGLVRDEEQAAEENRPYIWGIKKRPSEGPLQLIHLCTLLIRWQKPRSFCQFYTSNSVDKKMLMVWWYVPLYDPLFWWII